MESSNRKTWPKTSKIKLSPLFIPKGVDLQTPVGIHIKKY